MKVTVLLVALWPSLLAAEEDACEDRHSCLALELRAWLDGLRHQGAAAECQAGVREVDPYNTGPSIYRWATNCEEEGAVWFYKYSGGKGKGRIPKGKGKLSFAKSSAVAPHGYDYGMKTGRCVVLSSSDVRYVEGVFDELGLPDGQAEVGFHDGRLVLADYTSGLIHGMARGYEPDIDRETNLEKAKKRLQSLSAFSRGKVLGGGWTFRKEGAAVYAPLDATGAALVIVPRGNETLFLKGQLERQDVLLKASKVRLVAVEEANCLKVPNVEDLNENGESVFDFDLELMSETNFATAKLTRFFEQVTDDKKSLKALRLATEKDVDAANSVRIMDFKRKAKLGRGFLAETVDGERTVLTEGAVMDNGRPRGAHVVRVLSDWRRRDVLPPHPHISTSTKSKNTKEEDDDGVEVEIDQNGQVAKEDAEVKVNNATTNMSHDEYERYLDEFLPYDSLPWALANMRDRVVSVTGHFDDGGQLQGDVTVKYGDGSQLEGVAVNGTLHGLARRLDPILARGQRRKRYIRRQVENVAQATGLIGAQETIREVSMVGAYVNGRPRGPSWKFLVGGTFLYGSVHSGHFTTDAGAFIAQDLEHCYLGRFAEGKMVEGKRARVIDSQYDEATGVITPTFSEPEGPVYRHVEQEEGSMTDPLVADPTEEQWVYVAASTLGPAAGEGLFAKREIPANTVVAYFGGMRLTVQEWNRTKTLDPHYWRKVDDGSVIHLPDDVGRSTEKYKATLGHKINHSFFRYNCLFHSLDHPRFGLIPAARVVERVTEGAEILCHYEIGYAEGAPWFQELWRREIDGDFVHGPFGHRGAKREGGQPIAAMLTEGELYGQFTQHAAKLGLLPLT